MLKRIKYVSRATSRWDDSQLLQLLAVARVNNDRDDITGLLMVSAGNFFQTIEGPPAKVDALYQTILCDPRHTCVSMLEDETVESPRLFAGWAMRLFEPEDFESKTTEHVRTLMQTLATAQATVTHHAEELEQAIWRTVTSRSLPAK